MFTQIDILSNMGGIVSAQFVYTSNVKSFLKLPGSHEIFIELNEGVSWSNLYMSPNAGLTEQDSEDESGTLYSQALQLRYPTISASISHQNRLLMGRKLIVKLVTSNGNTIYIGSPDYPASFSFKKLIGDNAASFAGYQAIFSAIQPYSILFASNFTIQT